MTTWTYRLAIFTVDEVELAVGQLNELGAQGWECFQLEIQPAGLIKRTFRCWMKRAGRPVDPSAAELA